jgi:Integrase core domain
MGRSPGRRTAPLLRPVARRHHRGDAALRQSCAVAQAIHRCLQRHGIAARLTPEKAPAVAFQTDTPAGFVHLDVKYLPPLNRRRSYAYVAIDRATRFVYLEILPDRRAATAAGFLQRFLDSFALKVHTVLTDNGSEFTDRFAVDEKGKPHDKPSGQHPVDRVCAQHAITHRAGQAAAD